MRCCLRSVARFQAGIPLPATRQLPTTLKPIPLSRVLAYHIYRASGGEEAGGGPDKDPHKRRGRKPKRTERSYSEEDIQSENSATTGDQCSRAQQETPEPSSSDGYRDDPRTDCKKRGASRQRRQTTTANKAKSKEKDDLQLPSRPAHETAARDMELRVVLLTRLNLKPDIFRPPRSSWKRLKVGAAVHGRRGVRARSGEAMPG